MKQLHTFFTGARAAACALLLAAGCTQEIPTAETPVAETGATAAASATLVARIEGAAPVTKTSYDSFEGVFKWNNGDSISIHFSGGSYVRGAIDPATGMVAVDAPSGQERDCYAVYPATAAVAANYGNTTLQVNLPASYDISAIVAGTSPLGAAAADYSPCPMVAVNNKVQDRDTLNFCHVGGLLRLTIGRESLPASVRAVRLTFDKDVTGDYTVSGPSTDAPSIATAGIDAGNVVTFILAAEGSGVGSLSSDLVLNVPVPCGRYTNLKAELISLSGAVLATDYCIRPLNIARHHGKKVLLFSDRSFAELATPLTIVPKYDGTTITIPNAKGNTFKVGINGGTPVPYHDAEINIQVNAGDLVALYMDNPITPIFGMNGNKGGIDFDQPCMVYGNVMSLLSETDFASGAMSMDANQFQCLFFGNTNLINHDDPGKNILLPATGLSAGCYVLMFGLCEKLTRPPILPATTLTNNCYSQMFYGCTSLASAPALPATSLTSNCYNQMFSGCTSLVSAPALPAATLADNCYRSMFFGCTSLASPPSLPATTLTNYCYRQMFYGCTSLAYAPALPAATLSDNCYRAMFFGCTSLASAPDLPATSLTNRCYEQMFSGCTSLVSAPEIKARTLAVQCCNEMFSNCTELVSGPALMAEIPTDRCYRRMFYGCTKLASLKCNFSEVNYYFDGAYTQPDFNDPTYPYCATLDWVQNAGSGVSGVFERNPAVTWYKNPSGVPTSWTITDIK